jgi:hypothetical protein
MKLSSPKESVSQGIGIVPSSPVTFALGKTLTLDSGNKRNEKQKHM